jgi:hypothetical protein
VTEQPVAEQLTVGPRDIPDPIKRAGHMAARRVIAEGKRRLEEMERRRQEVYRCFQV